MNTDYADAVAQFEAEVDQAVSRARNTLDLKEVIAELRRIADGWEEEL